ALHVRAVIVSLQLPRRRIRLVRRGKGTEQQSDARTDGGTLAGLTCRRADDRAGASAPRRSYEGSACCMVVRGLPGVGATYRGVCVLLAGRLILLERLERLAGPRHDRHRGTGRHRRTATEQCRHPHEHECRAESPVTPPALLSD